MPIFATPNDEGIGLSVRGAGPEMSHPATRRVAPPFSAEPGKRTMTMTRLLDAPRQLVWEAHTKPEHLVHWWGGAPGSRLVVCEIDLRPRGAWRFVERAADGQEFTFHGTFLEVDPPHRLVETMIFDAEGWRHRAVRNTLTLDEENGRTRLTETSTMETVEDRDAWMKAGAEAGGTRSLDRLVEYLATL
jgi:uncharacterized protein YndB with AHSA1/START domain